MSTIGKRIAKQRKKMGLTQNALAEILMVSNKAISKWESDLGNPSFEFLPRLCEVLDCSADYLILGEQSFDNYKKIKNGIAVKLGLDYQGNEYYEDITQFPHLLVLGSTGTGKSCLFHSFIIDIIKTYSPDKVKLGLIDPKNVEFKPYRKIPHLMHPIAFTDDDILSLLENAKKEVEKRYTMFIDKNVKNIIAYNNIVENKLPYNVIIVDELADIVLNNKKAENILLTLCIIGRGAGFHIVVGTQRLRSDTISDEWKEISAKICFNVASKERSEKYFLTSGAELLKHPGEMLYSSPTNNQLLKFQVLYYSPKDIYNILKENGWNDDIADMEHSFDFLDKYAAFLNNEEIPDDLKNLPLSLDKLDKIINSEITIEDLFQ